MSNAPSTTTPSSCPERRRTRREKHGRIRAAFTLLELLLASAVFGSIAALGATLYLQSTRLGVGSIEADRSLTLQRVTALAREQWDDRRAMAADDASGLSPTVAALFAPGSVTFVTATPVLFPDWPLVLATYSIAHTDPGSGDTPRALVYTETRITDPSESPEAVGRTPDGERRSASITLVAPCDELVLERFGPEREPGVEDGTSTAFPADPEPSSIGWHIYDDSFGGQIYAVRFVGILHGDIFTCTFLAEPSR